MSPPRDDIDPTATTSRDLVDLSQVALAQVRIQLSIAATSVDTYDKIPDQHFDTLASAGLYGVFAPPDVGGLGLDLDATCSVIEELASACLSTTFVWIQHFRLLGALLDPSTPARLRQLLPRVVSGDLKGGVALGGLLPGPARLRAEGTEHGWRLEGEAPWVSGWGIVDRLFVTARNSDDQVVSLLVDAKEQPGLEASPVHLSALNASSTVRLDFRGLAVDDEYCFGLRPYRPQGEAAEGLRANGSLALGVARRCCELMGPSALDAELTRCRRQLAGATAESVAGARARASLLATRAARRLSILQGSSAALAHDVAERSNREAALLLVFGSRPSIKAAMLDQLDAEDGEGHPAGT